jgi:DNA-binding protein HU-beta
MDEFRNNDLVCVTRYCPHCGTEIFCRSDYDKHRVFYISEDMTDPTNTCPRCQFNLLLLPLEALMAEPDRRKEKSLLPRKVKSGKTLIESLRSKDPETFTSKASARRALNAVGAIIFDVLSGGEGVRWGGLGSFKIRQRKPRKGRNPRTGEELQIPARKAITFSPAKALKQRLNA